MLVITLIALGAGLWTGAFFQMLNSPVEAACAPCARCPESECLPCPPCESCPTDPIADFTGPGMWLVGVDIEPGDYKMIGDCYWDRLSCLTGGISCWLDNGQVEGQGYVTILPTDKAFDSSFLGRSCTFTKIND